MRRTSFILFLAIASMLAASDADARRSRKKARPAAPAETATIKGDKNMLCDGGMMITSDDQIHGCTAIIKSGGQSRDRRSIAFYNRGNAYIGKNDFGRAIKDYTDALAIKSDYAPAFFNRAVAYRISGTPQLAISDYTSALMLAPNDADAFAGRGAAYATIGKHDMALQDFDRSIAIQAGNLGARTQRGHTYVRMQRWAEAIADYDVALVISKVNVEAIYGRGVAKFYAGDVPGGQADLMTALAADSGITARMTSQGILPPQPPTAQGPQQQQVPASDL